MTQSNFEKIKYHARERGLDDSPLSGVIITGDGKNEIWYNENDLAHPYLINNEVPVLTTKLETYDTVVAISRIEVKINTSTPWKVQRAIKLIQSNISINQLIESL